MKEPPALQEVCARAWRQPLELLGRRTWMLPGWLGRRLPTFEIEGTAGTPALEEA